MSKHRPDQDTAALPPAGDDDLQALAREAAEHLTAAARAADAAPERAKQAAQDVITGAIGEAVRIARRGYRLAVVAAIVVGLCVSVPISVIAYSQAKQAGTVSAQLAAGDAASSEVTSARSSSLLVVRRDLTTVNNAMVAAGLTPCADPGPQASAYQVSWLVGECAGTLRTVGELQKKGSVQLPGVTAPDPASGSFPSAGR